MIEEVASHPRYQHFLKTFRESNKVLAIQKQRNERGRYITLKEFGVSKNKGFVLSLKVEISRVGFSQVLTEIIQPRRSGVQATGKGKSRLCPAQVQDRIPNNNLLRRSFKDVMNQAKDITTSLPQFAKTSTGRNYKGKEIVNDSFQFFFKVIIEARSNGSWEVMWARGGELCPVKT